MSRLVSAGSVIYDQLDIYLPLNSYNRVTGIQYTSLSLTAFLNNALVNLNLLDGSVIPDSSISSGNVYFNEISGAPGYYSVRTFFGQTGFWKLRFFMASYSLEIIREYDVVPAGSLSGQASNGLVASFIKS